MVDVGFDRDLLRRRILAFVTDLFVLNGIVYALLGRVVRSRGRRLLATGFLGGLLGFPYHVALEGGFGQTVGKRLLGVAVRRSDGTPCTPTAAAVRTALRLADWLPVGYLLGSLSIAITDRDRRIGDVVAGTVVVRIGEDGGGNGRSPPVENQGVVPVPSGDADGEGRN